MVWVGPIDGDLVMSKGDARKGGCYTPGSIVNDRFFLLKTPQTISHILVFKEYSSVHINDSKEKLYIPNIRENVENI